MNKKGMARMFRRLAALGLAGGMFWCGTQGERECGYAERPVR